MTAVLMITAPQFMGAFFYDGCRSVTFLPDFRRHLLFGTYRHYSSVQRHRWSLRCESRRDILSIRVDRGILSNFLVDK
jgi:hypothetical protein